MTPPSSGCGGTLEAKCCRGRANVAGVALGSRDAVRVAGRRTPEKHEHEYQSIE